MIIEMYCPACGETGDLDEGILLSPGDVWITCSYCNTEFRVEMNFYEVENG